MKQAAFTGRLRDLRIQSGLTQAEVSCRLNIQRATYSNYENEKRMPPLEILAALAELYGVSMDYIIRGVEPANTEPRTAKEQKLLSDFSSLSEDGQQEVLHFMEYKKLFSN